ncbi:Copper transport outer membrane protein, MctB [Thermosyntropha lipolytica DSM 11003]|uniref:Copper transport outer membrane protein, MctB n=1 Tax=Thermosyntropha lipolytica DSM 11003 TaxID=1123382 RepID=A0A1M5J837_9FIRM|nr:copper transporter [Thermosyntropha lipolytica]SHG36776.1 Copper transport outer membrane protein, MctB [Thermosyntropha lipolytica DSM 11003]
MVDIRYHIATIIAVFLALGLGILIGSTIKGDGILVDQQQKIIDRLENEFKVLRERENVLLKQNENKNRIIENYENYSRTVMPFLVKDHLKDYKLAVVVTGTGDIPAGMINALNLAGAEVSSKTVVLANIKMGNAKIIKKVIDFYHLPADTSPDVLRQYIAESVAQAVVNKATPEEIKFLQENELVKFNGDYTKQVNGVILVGGCNSVENYLAPVFDQRLIEGLLAEGVKVLGVEVSDVEYSYMPDYQKNNISTVDNIDLSTGQIALVFALEGEAGHYGIKETAEKFMPSLPVDALGGEKR